MGADRGEVLYCGDTTIDAATAQNGGVDFAAVLNGTTPAVEQMATVSRFPYGKIRVWGTIGYAVGTQVSGILYRYVSPGAMYQICGMGMVLCMAGLLGRG